MRKAPRLDALEREGKLPSAMLTRAERERVATDVFASRVRRAALEEGRRGGFMHGFPSAFMLAFVWFLAYLVATPIINAGWFGLVPFLGAGALHYHVWVTKTRDAATRAADRAARPLMFGLCEFAMIYSV